MAYKNKETQKEYTIQRPCTVCGIVKLKYEFNPYQHKCKSCEVNDIFKCCRCKSIKHRSDFPNDSSKKSKISSYCRKCKYEKQGKRIRIKKYKKKVTPLVRIRWVFKDCLKRLNRAKTSNTFKTLGFTKEQFLEKFSSIPKGKDIDHCIPLSWFKEDTPIKISCSLHNLQLLDSSVNSFKKNIFCHKPTDSQYIIDCLPFIKEEYVAIVENL